MVTGASTAEAAVVLVDARKGMLTQTRRHSWLVHLVGIRNIVLAVTKMDLVDYDQAAFDAIVADFGEFARSIGIERFSAIPVSGLRGDNVVSRTVGELPRFDFTPLPHWELGPALGVLDFDRGVKISGSRFYVLTGAGARLQRALIDASNEENAFRGWVQIPGLRE